MTKTNKKAGTFFQSLWVNDVKILFSKGQIKSNSIRLNALIENARFKKELKRCREKDNFKEHCSNIVTQNLFTS